MRRLVAGIAMMIVFTAGCAPATGDGPSPQLMSYDELVQEYRNKVDSYPNPLPKGKTFPAKPKKPQEPTVFEQGEGVVTADEFWICAWIGEWLKTHAKKPHEAAIAMQWVDKADDTEFHREHYFDPTSVWRNEIVGPAKLGDPTSLRDYYQNGCAEREGLGPVG